MIAQTARFFAANQAVAKKKIQLLLLFYSCIVVLSSIKIAFQIYACYK